MRCHVRLSSHRKIWNGKHEIKIPKKVFKKCNIRIQNMECADKYMEKGLSPVFNYDIKTSLTG